MSNPWFRMYVDFLDDRKMLALAFEDQRHYIGVLALKCAGVLDQGGSIELIDRLIAQRLWIDFAAIGEVKRRLMSVSLIDANWQPLGWEKRQYKSDHDVTAAERQRRYRERKRYGTENALGHGCVTPLDTDTDTDKLISVKEANASLTTISHVDADAPTGLIGPNKAKRNGVPYLAIVEMYREILVPPLADIARLSDRRKQAIAARWREELPSEEKWREYFEYLRDATKLTKGWDFNGRPWKPDFDWLVNPTNLLKVEEGKYDK